MVLVGEGGPQRRSGNAKRRPFLNGRFYVIAYIVSIYHSLCLCQRQFFLWLPQAKAGLAARTEKRNAPGRAESDPLLMDTLTFRGYKRPSGEVGIRNYVYILPTVFCANGFAEKLARVANEIHPKSENCDGLINLSHFSGCCEEGANLEYEVGIAFRYCAVTFSLRQPTLCQRNFCPRPGSCNKSTHQARRRSVLYR